MSSADFEIYRYNCANNSHKPPKSPVLSQSPNFLDKIYLIIHNLLIFLFEKI